MKKRKLVLISVVLITIFTFILCFSALSHSKQTSALENTIRVVLDAGHGGIDGGVTGKTTGVKESELNLQVVKKLEKLFIAGGFDVVLTRSTDAGLYGVATTNRKRNDMQKRKEIIEEASPTVMISVHMNYFPISSRSGGQVFFKEGDENSINLANAIQKQFNELSGKTKGYESLCGDYYILKCTDYTSVLAECGFLSNSEDEKRLMQDEYQEKIAYAIFKGTIDYLSVSSMVFCD